MATTTLPPTNNVTEPPPEAMAGEITKDLERLKQMTVIGEDIAKMGKKLTRQQTEEAKAKSALKEERSKTRTIETELEKLHNDLATLAQGGFVERFEFKPGPKDVAGAATINVKAEEA